MVPANLNITIYKGDDFSLIFRMRDSVTNMYVDLSERSARAHIRPDIMSETIIDDFNVSILDQTVTPGGVLLTLTPDQTTALPLTGGVYDVELFNVDVEGNPLRTWVRTPLAGSVIVLPEVTRD